MVLNKMLTFVIDSVFSLVQLTRFSSENLTNMRKILGKYMIRKEKIPEFFAGFCEESKEFHFLDLSKNLN